MISPAICWLASAFSSSSHHLSLPSYASLITCLVSLPSLYLPYLLSLSILPELLSLHQRNTSFSPSSSSCYLFPLLLIIMMMWLMTPQVAIRVFCGEKERTGARLKTKQPPWSSWSYGHQVSHGWSPTISLYWWWCCCILLFPNHSPLLLSAPGKHRERTPFLFGGLYCPTPHPLGLFWYTSHSRIRACLSCLYILQLHFSAIGCRKVGCLKLILGTR